MERINLKDCFDEKTWMRTILLYITVALYVDLRYTKMFIDNLGGLPGEIVYKTGHKVTRL